MDTLPVSPPANPRRWLWAAAILLGMGLLLALQPPASAQASNGYAYYWNLVFDFDSGADGALYVAVGYDDNGGVQDPPIYAETIPVPCTRVGNATIAGGLLTLNGGHLRCDLDLKTALEDAFAACGAIVPGCSLPIGEIERYANFRAMARVRSTNPGTAPLFYHEDASYAIDPQTASTRITASLTPHGAIPSTPVVSTPALNVWQTYTARYICNPGCSMHYGAAGSVEVVVTPNEAVQFSTPATSVYIGFDPGAGLPATAGTIIDRLFVDPPNHGND